MGKRGIKKGQQLTQEHRRAISEGRKGLQTGKSNPNYKQDRTQIKCGVASFTLTADILDWWQQQPNKSQYILKLIREDIIKHKASLL